MPELPEVECLTRAVASVAEGRVVEDLLFFRKDLREPIPITALRRALLAQPLRRIYRRSKYMIFATDGGYGLLHLGMTGNLLLRNDLNDRLKHTHFAIQLAATRDAPRQYLHYVDPRRFGRLSACKPGAIAGHPYLAELGPEPLEIRNLGRHLFEASCGRKQAVKAFLMDAHIVVGVGNIYASESLYRAGIHPARPAGSVAASEYRLLAQCIRQTLRAAIKAGGTTFRDYKSADGEPGYFALQLVVYGNAGNHCKKCHTIIQEQRIAGRSSFFCAICQN